MQGGCSLSHRAKLVRFPNFCFSDWLQAIAFSVHGSKSALIYVKPPFSCVLFKKRTGFIPILYRFRTDFVPISYRFRTDFVPISYRFYPRHTDFVPIFKHPLGQLPSPAFPPSAPVECGDTSSLSDSVTCRGVPQQLLAPRSMLHAFFSMSASAWISVHQRLKNLRPIFSLSHRPLRPFT